MLGSSELEGRQGVDSVDACVVSLDKTSLYKLDYVLPGTCPCGGGCDSFSNAPVVFAVAAMRHSVVFTVGAMFFQIFFCISPALAAECTFFSFISGLPLPRILSEQPWPLCAKELSGDGCPGRAIVW